jgi:hypothetical protein
VSRRGTGVEVFRSYDGYASSTTAVETQLCTRTFVHEAGLRMPEYFTIFLWKANTGKLHCWGEACSFAVYQSAGSHRFDWGKLKLRTEKIRRRPCASAAVM